LSTWIPHSFVRLSFVFLVRTPAHLLSTLAILYSTSRPSSYLRYRTSPRGSVAGKANPLFFPFYPISLTLVGYLSRNRVNPKSYKIRAPALLNGRQLWPKNSPSFRVCAGRSSPFPSFSPCLISTASGRAIATCRPALNLPYSALSDSRERDLASNLLPFPSTS